MKKEIPVLFSTAMVQAILEGRKTVTRRIMKPQLEPCNHSDFSDAEWKDEPINWVNSFKEDEKDFWYCGLCGNGVAPKNNYKGIKCPYGKVGDVLWVRESWRKAPRIEYRADFNATTNIKWKPSIHMPKEAARIWLEVTDVCVERLQDISEEDAEREGIEIIEHNCFKNYDETSPYQFLEDPIGSFKSLWYSINGPESWNANPWVWVVSIKILGITGRP